MPSRPQCRLPNLLPSRSGFRRSLRPYYLSDAAEKKAIYDDKGEQYLKEGVLKDPTLIGKYKFTTDPE